MVITKEAQPTPGSAVSKEKQRIRVYMGTAATVYGGNESRKKRVFSSALNDKTQSENSAGVSALKYVCMYVCMYICMYVSVCILVCLYVSRPLCMYVYMPVCLRVYHACT